MVFQAFAHILSKNKIHLSIAKVSQFVKKSQTFSFAIQRRNAILPSALFLFEYAMNLREELAARGLLYQMTDENFFDLYEKGGEKFYCGYDPTADSLHLGHFLTFMAAVNFMKRGNTFVMII